MLGLPTRHDQNFSLWHLRRSGDLELVHHWEVERFSREKHHSSSLPSTGELRAAVGSLLAQAGVSWSDIKGSWGTPGLDFGPAYASPDPRFPVHAMAHLYSVMLSDTDRLRDSTTLVFAMDGGPDHMLGRTRHQYVGALADRGKISYVPIESPGRMFNSASNSYGLEAGSLMALATASGAEITAPLDLAKLLEKLRFEDFAPGEPTDAYDAGALVVRLVDQLARLTPIDRHERCTDLEQITSATMKAVQAAACVVMERNVQSAAARWHLDLSRTNLGMAGGFALNCPTNSWMMDRFGFADFVGTPCANDSGQSIGLGLMVFHSYLGEKLRFFDPGAYMGSVVTDLDAAVRLFDDYIVSVSAGTDHFVDDLSSGPVAWVEGRAEIGPRALGHRSLLCDPRSDASRDRMNSIKQRQWWRPVAPIVLAAAVDEYFETSLASPYMLHTARVRPDKAHVIPAVLHVDRTARYQTLEAASGRIHDALVGWARATGVPVIGNSSLNDRGEPIVQTASEAIRFCLHRGVKVAYVDGVRVQLDLTAARRRGVDPLTATGWPDASGPVPSRALLPHELYFAATHPFQFDVSALDDRETTEAVRRAARQHYEENEPDRQWVEAFMARRSSPRQSC